MPDLQEFWTKTLVHDLEGFADPRTDVLVDENGATLTAMWSQRGSDRTAAFRISPDLDFRWLPSPGASPQTYREFLCSQDLADFRQLADAIVRTFPAAPNYISTKAMAEGNGVTPAQELSHSLLFQKSSDALTDPSGKTQLFFVKGDAGSGKTTLLRQITRQQAERYREGKSSFLFLYVSAQGRALSNLRDALSGELDDLRAGFTRDAVPALVRQGLIVPIIDGFDELLGAAGYGDAFGSLHQFLDQLAGSGVLIVSARSSFYDVEFVGRELLESGRASAYDIAPVTLCPWGENEVFQYLARARGLESISDDDRKAILELPKGDRELLEKPFFASKFPEYADSSDGKSKRISLSKFLVDSYVLRESGKIVDRDGRPLLDVDGHRKIFVQTAEFMWQDERRDYNADDLRTVAELIAADVGLAGDSAKQLVTKITSYAGFRASRSGLEQRFKFEHEVYFDHFLSEALRSRMGNPEELGRFLNWGLVPEEIIKVVVDGENAARWIDLLEGIRREGVLQENCRRNAGTLAAACFRALRVVRDRTINFCQFVNTSFGATPFESVRFEDCGFVGVRLEGTKFRNCDTLRCMAESLVISGNCEMGLTGLTPGENLYCVVDAVNHHEIFSPGEMRALLHGLGMPGMEMAQQVKYSQKAESLIGLLQRLVQKYRQSNLICLEDDRLTRLFRDPDWPLLLELLRKHDIVSEETRQTSGTRKIFMRYKTSLVELMRLERKSGLPSGTLGNFWNDLRNNILD